MSEDPVHLFGTSVGAFKLAAACHSDPAAGLDALARGYIEQSYPDGVSPDEIEREMAHLVEVVIGGSKGAEILSHPYLRFGCGAVRCHGWLAHRNPRIQGVFCAQAAVKNLAGRGALKRSLDRVVFHDQRASFPIASLDGYRTSAVPLHEDNLLPALKASGSIPVFMHGIEDIPGAGSGTYRDGGLLDYHPVPGTFWSDSGVILYPHFYDFCKVGWFDKYLPWRQAPAELMDNVLLISPTAPFYERTRLGRAPDRRDFVSYQGRDGERMSLWQEVADLSHELGEEFLHLAQSGELVDQLQPLPA